MMFSVHFDTTYNFYQMHLWRPCPNKELHFKFHLNTINHFYVICLQTDREARLKFDNINLEQMHYFLTLGWSKERKKNLKL